MDTGVDSNGLTNSHRSSQANQTPHDYRQTAQPKRRDNELRPVARSSHNHLLVYQLIGRHHLRYAPPQLWTLGPDLRFRLKFASRELTGDAWQQ